MGNLAPHLNLQGHPQKSTFPALPNLQNLGGVQPHPEDCGPMPNSSGGPPSQRVEQPINSSFLRPMGLSASQTAQQAASSYKTFYEDSTHKNLQADGPRSQDCVPTFKSSRNTSGQRVEQVQDSAIFLPIGQQGSSSLQDPSQTSDKHQTGTTSTSATSFETQDCPKTYH